MRALGLRAYSLLPRGIEMTRGEDIEADTWYRVQEGQLVKDED